VSVPWKCAFCPAEYSTQEEVDRHIESKWDACVRKHAEYLDKNWAFMHEMSMKFIRDALEMPEATVPEMAEAILKLRSKT
jgi:hypothetical protein